MALPGSLSPGSTIIGRNTVVGAFMGGAPHSRAISSLERSRLGVVSVFSSRRPTLHRRCNVGSMATDRRHTTRPLAACTSRWSRDLRRALLRASVRVDRRSPARGYLHGAFDAIRLGFIMETLIERLKRRAFAIRGRKAKTASARVNLLKTLAQSLVMWVVFLGICPWLIRGIEQVLGVPGFEFSLSLAGALFVAGWALAWSSAYVMVTRGDGTPLPLDGTNKLVVAGPYCFVRNPMAVGSLAQCAAVGLALGSPLVLVYTFAGAVIWNYSVRLWEEADLKAKFGADYVRYRNRVRCWWPQTQSYRG